MGKSKEGATEVRVRELSASTVQWFREQAAANGRSLEGHLRFLLENMARQ